MLSDELFKPRFKISRLRALRARLLHNYWALYGVILMCWILKIIVHPVPAENWGDVKDHLAMGFMPWWSPFAYLGLFVTAMLVLVVGTPKPPEDTDHWHFSP